MAKKGTVGLGAFVCVFSRDFNKILLLKRKENDRKTQDAFWGNVGGMIEFGKTSRQAAVREAKEEAGLKIDPADLVFIRVIESPHFLPHVHAVHFVYATTINEKAKIKLNAESEEYGWFDLARMPKRMLDRNEDVLAWRDLAKKKSGAD